jgi:hypothetical protein
MLEPDDDLDGRIRDWLQPDQQTVERVTARALSAQPRGRRIVRVLALSALASLLMAAAGTWIWRSTSTDVDEFTATFEGDVLLIRASDGTSWILGPQSGNQPPAGTGQITFEGERR